MAQIFSLALGTFVVMLSWSFPGGAFAQESSLDTIKEKVESALESDESKMKRGLQELDARRAQEEQLRGQQLELERLEWEKQQLLRRPRGASAIPVRPTEPIELFVTDNCPDCLKAIGYLDALGVTYQARNISRDPAAEQEYLSNFGRGVVPVLRTRGATLRGYAPEQYRLVTSGRRSTPYTAASRNSGGSGRTAPNTGRSLGNVQKGSPSGNDFAVGAVATENPSAQASETLDSGARDYGEDPALPSPPRASLPPARKLEANDTNNLVESPNAEAGTSAGASDRIVPGNSEDQFDVSETLGSGQPPQQVVPGSDRGEISTPTTY